MNKDDIPKGLILAVDDENKFLDDITKMLEQEFPNEVLSADSCEKAVEVCKERRGEIAVILMDQIMPISGIDTLKSLRELDPNINVVFLTVVSKSEIEPELLGFNIQGYFKKPLVSNDYDDLFSLLRELILKYRMSALLYTHIGLPTTNIPNLESLDRMIDTFIANPETLFEMHGYVKEFIDDYAVTEVYQKDNKEMSTRRLFPRKLLENLNIGEGMIFLLKSEVIGNRIVTSFFQLTEDELGIDEADKIDFSLDDGVEEDDY